MSAVLKEQFEVADLLLTMGQARVDARNQHKETALQMATKMKNKARVVLFLRQRGAVDPSAPRPKPALSKVTIQQRLKRHTVVDKMKDLRDRRSLVKMERIVKLHETLVEKPPTTDETDGTFTATQDEEELKIIHESDQDRYTSSSHGTRASR